MLKIILTLAFTFTAFSTFAENSLRCSCQRTFKDFLGNESDVTVHAFCPEFSNENELNCSSTTDDKAFTVTCANTVTGQSSVTAMELEPMTKPTYGYAFCQLN